MLKSKQVSCVQIINFKKPRYVDGMEMASHKFCMLSIAEMISSRKELELLKLEKYIERLLKVHENIEL